MQKSERALVKFQHENCANGKDNTTIMAQEDHTTILCVLKT
jgi:hypothetical protein